MVKLKERLESLSNDELVEIIEKLYLNNNTNKIFLDMLFLDEDQNYRFRTRIMSEIEKTFWLKGNLKSPTFEKLKQIYEYITSISYNEIRFECCLVFADELSHYISNIYHVNERYVTLLFSALEQCVYNLERDENLINKYIPKILSYDFDQAFVDIGEVNNYCFRLTNKDEEEE